MTQAKDLHVTITWANDPISALCYAPTVLAVDQFLFQHGIILQPDEHTRLILGYDVHVYTTHDNARVSTIITLD